MLFASDNWSGASAPVLAAVTEALSGPEHPAYGADAVTARVEARMSALFEREVSVHLIASGTAANALSLAHLTRPWGAVFCHAASHVMTSECGAAEAFGGLKLIGVAGAGAKMTPATLAAAMAAVRPGDAHSVQFGAISLTNLTECGLLYTPDEVRDLSAMARERAMAVHMDGARFANAVARLGCTPADLSWRAGVDALSFGATKNGAIAAEAVVFFDPDKGRDFGYRRMRAGHLISKHRFLSAQFEAWLADGHWLALAGHANAMADRLADGLRRAGVRLAWAVGGNEVFPILDRATQARLKAAGAAFHAWPSSWMSEPPPQGEADVCRLVCSFRTTPADVDAFIGALAHAAAAE